VLLKSMLGWFVDRFTVLLGLIETFLEL
jgi:hypothetical protein